MNFAARSQHAASSIADGHAALREIHGLTVRESVVLAPHTRFGIGGPADLFAETDDARAFAAAVTVCRESTIPLYILGDGSNVIVSDEGFRGLVLRFTAAGVRVEGPLVSADAGAPLESLVTTSVDHGLRGLETLARIPGSVGAAVYGNAGAYGHSISETVGAVEVFDGVQVRRIGNAECAFVYRGSVFKQHKDWLIFEIRFQLESGNRDELRAKVAEITAVRDEKFPPSMRCAGSIFKNLYLDDLPAAAAAEVPARVVREGKVASAYFLEQVGAKGMQRGGIRIADYHANLIYDDGGGTARELRDLIAELKQRVEKRFGIEVEEEVQYIGEV